MASDKVNELFKRSVVFELRDLMRRDKTIEEAVIGMVEDFDFPSDVTPLEAAQMVIKESRTPINDRN